MSRRLGALAWLGVTMLSCGGPEQVGGQPRWRKVTTPELGASSLINAAFTFSPTSKASKRYNDPPFETAPSSVLGDAITAAVDDAADKAGVDPPLADGRL